MRLSVFAVFVSGLAVAQQARFDDVVDQLDRVSIRARRAGGACRASVMDRVVDLADRLDAQRGQARGLPRVLDELSDLHALASARSCPDDVLDGLLVTMDLLNDVRATSWSADRRDDDFAVARLARLQVTVDPQQARLSLPELTLRGLKSTAFNLVLRVRAADGPWSELERTQRWSVPSDPFVWQSAWTFTVPRQKLAALDTSGGRFIARVSVLDDQNRELGYREAHLSLGAPPPPTQPVAQDCGAGLDLGCSLARGGVFPVDRATFTAALATVVAEKNPKKRVKAATTAFASTTLSAAQCALVLDQVPDDQARLELAGTLLGRVVNPGDLAGYATRFKSVDHRTKFNSLVQLQLNPNAQPKSWRVKGEMDRRAFTFEGRDPDDVRAKCRKWKEADISTQGFIMRLAIDGGRVRTDMLNTAEACDAVADAATPLY